jgi:hypothetical protein
MLFKIHVANHVRKKVLAVPECFQKQNNTQDRLRVNDRVGMRDRRGLAV